VKKLVFIALLALGFTSQGLATHILGGEITYEHIENLKYRVNIVIYRDCDECKLAGGGGGSSTKDCGSFELFVQRSDRYTCGSSVLDRFGVTRSSIRTILPVCPNANSSCDSNSNYAYGVEAHEFYTIVDFAKYASSASCGFDLFVKVFDRAGYIDNINDEQPGFFNYAFINPYETHNSPTFNSDPLMVLPVNEAVREIISLNHGSADKVVFELGQPLKDYQKEITYAEGYSKSKPLTVWCNATSTCMPDEAATPPIGYFSDTQNGRLIFTPTKTNEKGLLVFEIKSYKKKGSDFQLIGLVRRDIQVITVSSQNHPPKLIQNIQDFHICEGEAWTYDFKASDKIYVFPDGSSKQADSVDISLLHAIKNLQATQVSLKSAPYQKLRVSWTPGPKDVQTEPYRLYLEVKDNNCPLNASQTSVFNIYVDAIPKVKISYNKLWCGNLENKVETADGQKIQSSRWIWMNSSKEMLRVVSGFVDTLLAESDQKYYIENEVTNILGCRTVTFDSITFTKDELNGLNLTVNSKPSFCLNEEMTLTAEFKTSAKITEIKWYTGLDFKQNGSVFKEVISKMNPYPVGISVVAKGSVGSLNCSSGTEIYPVIKKGPSIVSQDGIEACTDSDFKLNNLVDPDGGTWSAVDHDALEGNEIKVSKLVDGMQYDLCQIYTLTDTDNGCTTEKEVCVRLNPVPVLELHPATICNFVGTFNLANLVSQPFGLGAFEVSWKINGQSGLYTHIDGKYLVDLSTLLDGEHLIECSITNSFGCKSTKTTKMILIKDLKVESTAPEMICQGDQTDLNVLYKINPKGGIWNSFSNFDDVLLNTINPNFCGDISLNYTYDQYGCYASEDFDLHVVCEPDIQFDLPDTICASTSEIELKAKPEGGVFSGENVRNNILVVDNIRRNTSVSYTFIREGCIFQANKSLYVAPAPRYKHEQLPAFVCEGEEIFLLNLQIEQGILSITRSNGTEELISSGLYDFVFEPTEEEIQLGFFSLTFKMIGSGTCPVTSKTHTILIHPKAEISLDNGEFGDCAPFKWQPKVTTLSSAIDWSKVAVEWNFGDPNSGTKNLSLTLNTNHVYRTPGTYTVLFQAKTLAGCETLYRWEDRIVVYETPQASFTVNPTEAVSVRLPKVHFTNTSIGNGQLSYSWDFGTSLSNNVSTEVSPVFYFMGDTGTYLVTLRTTNSDGCSDVAAKTIQVGQDIRVYIPNAFTPNRKGPESTESFRVIGHNVSDYEIMIQNRWGEIVFQSEDINQEWNGMYLNELCISGIYVYKIRAISKTGTEYEYSGTINLMR